jgi:putative Holliday junction resolvase
MAIDYGQKRCGVAVTDLLQISANPLITLSTSKLYDFIVQYCQDEEVETIVFGLPLHKDGNPTPLFEEVKKMEEKVKKAVKVKTDFEDESFTSQEAKMILTQIVRKKRRKEKKLTDLISAVLILQRYLNHI